MKARVTKTPRAAKREQCVGSLYRPTANDSACHSEPGRVAIGVRNLLLAFKRAGGMS